MVAHNGLILQANTVKEHVKSIEVDPENITLLKLQSFDHLRLDDRGLQIESRTALARFQNRSHRHLRKDKRK